MFEHRFSQRLQVRIPSLAVNLNPMRDFNEFPETNVKICIHYTLNFRSIQKMFFENFFLLTVDGLRQKCRCC